MLGQMFSIFVLLLAFSSGTFGLRCWSCENTDLFTCKRKGTMEQCDVENEEACQTEVRFSEGKTLIVKTGCKQGHACFNNHLQNPAGAWMPSQCNHGKENSVCRCCCEGNLCNKKRQMLLCKFPPEKVSDVPASSSPPKQEKACDEYPDTPENGKRECIGGYGLRAFCKFSCDKGYRMNGYSMTVCVQKGNRMVWNRNAPTCEKIDVCKPMPREPLNGHSECSGSGDLGTVCGFACDFGYELSGPSLTTCIRSEKGAVWSHETPACKPVCTSFPVTPKNGFKKCEGNREIGSTCKFSCRGGYDINGASETICQKVGERAEWSHESPTCEPTCRPLPKAPMNGYTACMGDGEVGTTCVFHCNPGYQMNGDATEICEATHDGADWSSRAPTCEPICEPMPLSPLNGRVKCDGQGEVGTTCAFECDTGTRMNGKAASTCVKKGNKANWNNNAPICEPVCDSYPNPPKHGSKVCHGDLQVGTTCSFSCNSGYKISGAEKSVCQLVSRGVAEWSEQAPICNPVCEPMPQAPLHGSVMCAGRGEVGTACTFTCFEGFELQGSSETTCQEMNVGADWTSPSPICTLIPTCDIPKALDNGQVQCDGTGEIGTTCRYTCNAEFEMKGSEISSCVREDDRAYWSSEPPVCTIIIIEPECPPLGDFPNGRIVCDNPKNTEGTICRFECLDIGYELVPQERLETRCSAAPELKWTVKKPCCVACSRAKKDIMIAMDSSGSIDPTEWKVMAKFVQKIVRSFNVSEEAVQFSIFQFSSAAKSDDFMYFGRYSQNQLIRKVGKMRRMGTGTMTGKALHYAQRRFRDPGNRKDVGDMLWVLTDGETEDMNDLKKISRQLRQDDVEIFALAIGPTARFVDQMIKMTGDKDKIMVAEDMDSLTDELVKRVAVKICEEECLS